MEICALLTLACCPNIGAERRTSVRKVEDFIVSSRAQFWAAAPNCYPNAPIEVKIFV